MPRIGLVRPEGLRYVVAVAAAAAAVWVLHPGVPSRAASPPGAEPHGGHAADHAMPMSAEAMERWVHEWFATHPPRGEHTLRAGGAADTFAVFSFGFDNDGNPADGVDTAFVFVGETVLWKRSDGSHTVTNGVNAADPNAGHLFDRAITMASPEFAFEFNAPGKVPFFCRPHSGPMRGVVQVAIPTDVVPISERGARPGFATDPAPNPTRDVAAFRFALARGGHVRVDVFDVRGRLVATPVDRTLGTGTYAASWNGRTVHGERATAGVYFLRLTVPGATDSREVVVTR
jgi:hypothetical protein